MKRIDVKEVNGKMPYVPKETDLVTANKHTLKNFKERMHRRMKEAGWAIPKP